MKPKKGKPRGKQGGAKPGLTPPMVPLSVRIRKDQSRFLESVPDKSAWLRDVIDQGIEAENSTKQEE